MLSSHILEALSAFFRWNEKLQVFKFSLERAYLEKNYDIFLSSCILFILYNTSTQIYIYNLMHSLYGQFFSHLQSTFLSFHHNNIFVLNCKCPYLERKKKRIPLFTFIHENLYTFFFFCLNKFDKAPATEQFQHFE